MGHEKPGVMVKIPQSQLSEEALHGIVEAFVLREGTDYGHRDHTLAEKRERVLEQLRNGEAELSFDPETGSVDIRLI
ncbi:MAG: YheU family protein [Gammaproteobacteria bacterium]|nr:YheU family protein [Gammaproteobacteria bacterium]